MTGGPRKMHANPAQQMSGLRSMPPINSLQHLQVPSMQQQQQQQAQHLGHYHPGSVHPMGGLGANPPGHLGHSAAPPGDPGTGLPNMIALSQRAPDQCMLRQGSTSR